MDLNNYIQITDAIGLYREKATGKIFARTVEDEMIEVVVPEVVQDAKVCDE